MRDPSSKEEEKEGEEGERKDSGGLSMRSNPSLPLGRKDGNKGNKRDASIPRQKKKGGRGSYLLSLFCLSQKSRKAEEKGKGMMATVLRSQVVRFESPGKCKPKEGGKKKGNPRNSKGRSLSFDQRERGKGRREGYPSAVLAVHPSRRRNGKKKGGRARPLR